MTIAAGVAGGLVVLGGFVYVCWRVAKFMLTDRGGFGGGPS